MNIRRRIGSPSVLSSAVGIVVLAAASLADAGAAQADPSVSIRPVVGGLAAPRGIVFDGRGAMYVSESGVAGEGPAGMTHTGQVDKFTWGSTTPAWRKGFNSLYVTEDPSAPPDVLGPEGLSVMPNGCKYDRRRACRVLMITSESTPGVRAATGGAVVDWQAGHLYRLNGATGAAESKSNVGSQMWAWTGDHSNLFSDFPDSNPYGVLVAKGAHGARTFVADAGANTISEILPHGHARVVSYIPNENFGAFRDATPTCIAQGPDGFLYVGTLDLASNFGSATGGLSSVWRVNPNANYPTRPTKWATGLTTISACTFDRHGNFWAAEMFAGGPGANPPGDIVRIPFAHPKTQAHFGLGQLALPGGIAQGPDGAMYVTVGSAAPGVSGGVLRVSVSDLNLTGAGRRRNTRAPTDPWSASRIAIRQELPVVSPGHGRHGCGPALCTDGVSWHPNSTIPTLIRRSGTPVSGMSGRYSSYVPGDGNLPGRGDPGRRWRTGVL